MNGYNRFVGVMRSVYLRLAFLKLFAVLDAVLVKPFDCEVALNIPVSVIWLSLLSKEFDLIFSHLEIIR